jgi:HK97 family phage portal protein
MPFFSRIAKNAGWVASDDRWYDLSLTQPSESGVNVTPDSALRLAAVMAAVRILSETLAMLPLKIMQRTKDGGKIVATRHPIYGVLHDKPNQWQTSFEWREMLMGHLVLRGNAYCQIVPGVRGFVDQLIPLHPDRVVVERNKTSGKLVYRVRRAFDEELILQQEEVFHVRGFSLDGITGMSVIQMCRETIGIGMAMESYAARFYANDATPGGILRHPGQLGEKAHKNLKNTWNRDHRSLKNAHKIAILEEGMEWQELGIRNQDAQFMEGQLFQISEIARIFRVPPHLIGDLSKATYSNIEHQGLEFVTYTMMPWLVRWEQAINRDLILPAAQFKYYSRFVVDALLRGDIKTRYEAYSRAIAAGWLSRNEAREKEDYNRAEGLDEFLVPVNMAAASNLDQLNVFTDNEDKDKDEAAEAATGTYTLTEHLARQAAERLVNKEILTVNRLWAKYSEALSASVFNDKLTEFYTGHEEFIRKVLPESVAKTLVAESRADLQDLCNTALTIEELTRNWAGTKVEYITGLILKTAAGVTNAGVTNAGVTK